VDGIFEKVPYFIKIAIYPICCRRADDENIDLSVVFLVLLLFSIVDNGESQWNEYYDRNRNNVSQIWHLNIFYFCQCKCYTTFY
jgi:hypothetical protein